MRAVARKDCAVRPLQSADVTEYGARSLHGLSLRERGEALVSIAHPDARGELCRALKDTRHYLVTA